MAATYPQRVAVVQDGKVIATVTVDSDGDRQYYSENFGTAVFSMEEAKTLGLPQKLRLEIVDALRAKQDAADLAEAGRRLMEKSARSDPTLTAYPPQWWEGDTVTRGSYNGTHGSGGAPDLGGPPAQKPPEPTTIDPVSEWVPFNVNDYVRVKLSDHGRRIHREDHDKFWAFKPDVKYTPPCEDEEGWSKWQLWSLMQAFGPHISLGSVNPFDTTIEFQKPPGPKLSDYACESCGSVPSELGVIEHGQCCYVVDSDGGGTTFVDLPDPVVAPFKAVPLTREDNLLIALHDAIRRPMGVVPTSAEPFVTDEGLAAAEKRRPRQVSQHCECHERDSSQVCDYCYANGRRGHMQKG